MLKKYILSFVAVSLFVASAFSQNSNIRLGIIANPNVSWLKSDVSRIQGDGSRIGFNIGLMVDKYFAEHYAFTTGLSIHSIGGTLKYRDGKDLHTSSTDVPTPLDPGSRVQYNLQYLHIPWGLKFKTTEIGYSTFFAQLGVNTMVNIKSRANVKDQDISKVGVAEEINMFYMGYHFSGGMEYKIVGNTALMIGVTYMNGFTDITQKSDEKTVMHCFEVRLGVVF